MVAQRKQKQGRKKLCHKSSIEYICPRGADGRGHLEHSTHEISRRVPCGVRRCSRGASCWRQRALWAAHHRCNSRPATHELRLDSAIQCTIYAQSLQVNPPNPAVCHGTLRLPLRGDHGHVLRPHIDPISLYLVTLRSQGGFPQVPGN